MSQSSPEDRDVVVHGSDTGTSRRSSDSSRSKLSRRYALMEAANVDHAIAGGRSDAVLEAIIESPHPRRR